MAEDAANLTGFPDTPLFDWGATVTFAIDNFTATPDDTIQLAVDTTTVDTLNYTAAAFFAFVPTATQSLEYSGTTPLAYSGTAFEVDTLNDLGTNWCIALSTTAWSGFAATPFAANTCN